MKIFNKWDSNVAVIDMGLKEYITLTGLLVPRSAGLNAKSRFHKGKTHIVERLVNKLMVPGHKGKTHRISSGHMCGKKTLTYKIVENAFDLIEKKTKQNPIGVFIKALENAAPREEITTIEYGGARYPQAVECSPLRRVDIALSMITQGAYHSSFRKKKSIETALAEEIINASNIDQKSSAISKKLELERQADASR
ncbi:MAG: 30S ribosomal protein S7 [Nanoarchaeota archaeon]